MNTRWLVLVTWVAAGLLVSSGVAGAADGAKPTTRPATGRDVVTLTPADVADPKGDGPDGKGNTEDDTWQFWFELAHARGTFHRLDLATATMSARRRQAGIPRKVHGPVASLPHPKETDGWIFHSDWDGRFEGVWGDKKAGHVLLHPYAEKRSHLAVAVTFRVPRDGAYDVSGKFTDAQVIQHRLHTGIVWRVEVVRSHRGRPSAKAHRLVGRGGPVGDKVGPDSQEFSFHKVLLKKGELLRFVVDPNKWWGSDLTRIDGLKIKRVK